MAPRTISAAREVLRRLASGARSTASSSGSSTIDPPAVAGGFAPNAAVAVIRADDGVLVFTSEAWAEAVRYSPDELVGRHVSEVAELRDEDVVGEWLHAINAALRRTGLWRGEMQILSSDGARVRRSAEITEAADDRYGRLWILHLTAFDAEPPSRPYRPASPAGRGDER